MTYSAKEMNKLSEVVLVEDTKTIDEVVVVGYTTRTREKLISSVSTINNQELVKSTTTKEEPKPRIFKSAPSEPGSALV